ncbi:kelch-like protein 10 [Limanda limanda]|uniref:kelch-like protein 10 n=1 Tax=Limanda limanda TaxID=27771 RepID=UPI0029C860C2|nr:kelch-like protein 10 [Limanda limanda]
MLAQIFLLLSSISGKENTNQIHIQMKGTLYNELRLAGLFCDAILKVEEVQFPIHRTILYECSPYFQALFKHCANTGQIFHIPLVFPDILRIIIEFAYTGSVASTEDNVQELMITADRLNIIGIIQECSHFMRDQICPQNCIGIWQFTNICHSSVLRERAFDYIIQHFEEIVPVEEFLQLSVKELTAFIARDELHVRKESVVFDAILRWIGHKPKEREQHIAVLLSQVRLGLTGHGYILTHVITNKLVKSNAECKQITEHSMCMIWHMSTIQPLTCGLSNTLARPRVPNSFLLVTGGSNDSGHCCNIETYDPIFDHCINIPDKLEHPRTQHGTVFLDGYVYCVGGMERERYFNSVVRLDLRTHTWQEVAPMHYRRGYVCVTVLDGFIYAIGGADGIVRLNTAERYCPETNQWTLIAPMHLLRSDASCTVLHGKIYMCGGYSGTECLQTAEFYDPETKRWTLTNPMSQMRRGLRVVAYNHQIYAIGGFDGNDHLSKVEAYDPQSNAWHLLSPMCSLRSNFCLEVIEDQFYVIGGVNGTIINENIDVYCPYTDIWDARRAVISRSFASSCLVSGIPNMAEFMISRDSLPHFNVDLGPRYLGC